MNYVEMTGKCITLRGLKRQVLHAIGLYNCFKIIPETCKRSV